MATTGQYTVVAQATPTPNQALGRISLFDEQGDPIVPGELTALDLPVGDEADITAGTDETPALWSAKDLHDAIAAAITAAGE